MAGQIEVITMFALFGLLVSIFKIAIFERKSLNVVSWSPEFILTFAGFGLAGFSFSSLPPVVLQIIWAVWEKRWLHGGHWFTPEVREQVYKVASVNHFIQSDRTRASWNDNQATSANSQAWH